MKQILHKSEIFRHFQRQQFYHLRVTSVTAELQRACFTTSAHPKAAYLNHSNGSRVTNTESLCCHSSEESFACSGSIQTHIAYNNIIFSLSNVVGKSGCKCSDLIVDCGVDGDIVSSTIQHCLCLLQDLLVQYLRHVQEFGLICARFTDTKQVSATHEILELAKTQGRHVLTNLQTVTMTVFQHEQIVNNMFWFALKLLPQHWILSSNANRTCVEVTLAHHGAAHHNERSSAKAKLISPKHCCYYNIKT
ncbi:hypothetical protein E2C01_013243 [Portunus trituberculatus]|uniref:Uncharacterized protein n=1 Tax=Portunus trituberculatus TaxID=210409 RepID=A0A5B7DGT7_PORTR|nr:hypothetical protein [Portunus trituberculatus]